MPRLKPIDKAMVACKRKVENYDCELNVQFINDVKGIFIYQIMSLNTVISSN